MARKTAARKTSKAVSPKQRRARQAARTAGRDDRSDYRNKVRAEKVEAAKKGDCLSRMFMLALPFAALGIYLVLRS
jgi:hypothetical protein